jgi:hypothetical protein
MFYPPSPEDLRLNCSDESAVVGSRFRKGICTSIIGTGQRQITIIALSFTFESAAQKVRSAEDRWHSRDPETAHGVERHPDVAFAMRVRAVVASSSIMIGGALRIVRAITRYFFGDEGTDLREVGRAGYLLRVGVGASVADTVAGPVVEEHLSCVTMPISARRLSCITSRMSWLSIRIAALDVMEAEKSRDFVDLLAPTCTTQRSRTAGL